MVAGQPNLYTLSVEVWNAAGGNNAKNPAHLLDNRSMRVGVRTVEITEKGLVLNGSLFPEKLIGGNRHQDFARLGNAVPNNLQWQDAVKLRKAGMRVIRSAHYPQDPAFMDACDRLGLFVIVATPGWQFWGKGPFADRVYDDIRQMVRRDRNHPSVMMWEPILNETHYPADFAKKARDLVHEDTRIRAVTPLATRWPRAISIMRCCTPTRPRGTSTGPSRNGRTTSRILPVNSGITWIPGPPITPPPARRATGVKSP